MAGQERVHSFVIDFSPIKLRFLALAGEPEAPSSPGGPHGRFPGFAWLAAGDQGRLSNSSGLLASCGS